jgi:hypothetical protein
MQQPSPGSGAAGPPAPVWGPVLAVGALLLANLVAAAANARSPLSRLSCCWAPRMFASNRAAGATKGAQPATFWGFDVLEPEHLVTWWARRGPARPLALATLPQPAPWPSWRGSGPPRSRRSAPARTYCASARCPPSSPTAPPATWPPSGHLLLPQHAAAAGAARAHVRLLGRVRDGAWRPGGPRAMGWRGPRFSQPRPLM